jgi:RNA polymerase sigma-70 factor (ECF subfamily)
VTGTDGFDDFYQATFGRLVAQVYLVTGDLHEAEDVVQEAMARASVRWQRLRDYDLPEAWVRRVAMNLAADQRRRVRRRLALLARIGPSPPAPALSVDHVAVVEALATLPRSYRQAVVLHHLLGLPVREVAKQLRVPVGTVKARLARARRALAQQLDASIQEV